MDFNCVVTSTCASCDARGEFHPRRAWGERGRKTQIDCIMRPRDLQFQTWYLDKVRLRSWGHHLVVVRIDGKELRVRKGKESWAGWIPRSEDERQSFKRRVLCPGGVSGLDG